MTEYLLAGRTIISLTGADRVSFLQGLITNDVTRPGLVYAALLNPQGKFIADFFLLAEAERLLLDVAKSHAQTLLQRLTLYRLRADVTIAETGLIVTVGDGSPPEGAYADPRHPALGWRRISELNTDANLPAASDQTALRIRELIPETGSELTPDTYILEAGFERLNGVDFKKGCFVGQEIVARMKYKTELRKGLARVSVEGPADPGTEITAAGKPAGVLMSRAGNQAIAFLRFDRAAGDMQAGEALVRWHP